MKSLLICPDARPTISCLAEEHPLALVPILGKNLLQYWLEHLADTGATTIQILASDRPEQVRAFVENGTRWGVQVKVIPETRELTPNEARSKYLSTGPAWMPPPKDILLMDRLPNLPLHPLLESYARWFRALEALLPLANTPDRIGLKEWRPGIWTGLRTRIAPSARLHPPCWLGNDVSIGPRAVVGPAAILEDRVFVDFAAEISHSIVGPETLVGELTELRNSLAWGNTLVNHRTGSSVHIPDPFFLCSLGTSSSPSRQNGWMGRLAAIFILFTTLPLALLDILRSRVAGKPAFRRCLAAVPNPPSFNPSPPKALVYYELSSSQRLKRWPQLWSIVRGDFAWVGNRPLTPIQIQSLSNDFERLWLAAPIGLISLADIHDSGEAFGDEARTHASFYAVQANWRMDLSIILHGILIWASGARYPKPPDDFRSSFEHTTLKETPLSVMNYENPTTR